VSSIINGLFAGRSGIASHGQAIAVIGDNISNSSTPGYKAARAEFEDLVAGGQAIGRITGSGSQLSAVSTIMNQGTLEFTGRTLDLAIDGNGFFAVQDSNGQRFYTRAGNFKLDTSGNIINQNGMRVMGFPSGGTGALEAINVNTISQANVFTGNIDVAGNLDARETELAATSAASIAIVDALGVPLAGAGANSTAVEFSDIANIAAFTTTVDIFDSLGQSHTVMLAFFKTDTNEFITRAYAKSEDLGESVSGYPRQITTAGGTATTGTTTLTFNSSGIRTGFTDPDKTFVIPWGNGSSTTQTVDLAMGEFTQYSSQSTIASINQDGQGIGNVTSLVIERDGSIFARLSNGQTATVGNIGMVTFANQEGLARVGNNLLQQSPSSGEPLAGLPGAGTLGTISSGSIELSTVDIANEFVKMITLQRGFQANSRIITTINQLLNEIIQLA
jgi:flagellar hook protein FlgE